MAEMEKKTVNAMGDVCPVPLVKAKNAIAELAGSGKVEVLVDNEIAVQNLEKMAQQKGYGFLVKEKKEKEYHVEFTVSETEPAETEEKTVCLVPAAKKTKLVVLSADHMGEGAEELGKILMKGFLYALSQMDTLPETILFYNGGVMLTTEGSESLEDLKAMEEQGVKIYSCGTCLDFYNRKDLLKVGEVTNMYTIVELMAKAEKILKP